MFPIGSLWLFHELDFIEGFAGTRKLYEDLIKPKDDLFKVPKDWDEIDRIQDKIRNISADPSSDCFHTINAWNSFQNTMIPSSGDCCLLSGVVCSQDKVIEIGWNSTGSIGTLPEEFGYLDQLKVLDLANNSLFGKIPASYYSLSSLENLRLKNNSLTGPLSSFKGLTQLRSLDLSYNQFSDEIPSDSFETLNDLKFINVAGNVALTGIFPNPGPSTQLISTSNTGITLCGKAASVAVVAYFGTRQPCPAGYRK